MKKRLITLILALSVLCVLFAACGTDKESNDTTVTVSDTAAGNNTEAGTQTSGIQKVTLSGNPEDTFVAEKDCYAEGEDVVVYFQKGINVRGDMLAITEKAMSDIEDSTGLDFGLNYTGNGYSEYRDVHLTEDCEGINEGAEKINVIVVHDPEGGAVACAFESGAVLDEKDYDFEKTSYQAVYHELLHVAHLRNYVDLDRVMNEGFAVYYSYIVMKEQNLPLWSHIQYFDPYDYDDTPVTQGRDGFSVWFIAKDDDNYQYGFRLVMFLECTYGKGTFMKIAEEAVKKGFDSSFSMENMEEYTKKDTDILADIIISQTSEDVFERFAQWNETEFPKKYQEYKEYMSSIGQSVG